MAASRRPGEITYYEELGVENTASADEIRDAFRALARLLHPDQQTDPQLHKMAELQMRKLNRIYAVLSDSARRNAYDESLNSPRSGPIIVFSGSDGSVSKLLMRVGVVGAIVFGAVFLIWLDSNNVSEVRGQEARNASAVKTGDNTEVDAGDQISRLRDQLRTAETERDSALQQLGLLGRKQTDGPSARELVAKTTQPAGHLLPTATNQSTNRQPSDAGSGATPVAGAPAATQFAGFWVYAKSAGSASPGGKSLYSPEFIEVTVTEQNGALHGQYRSRYQVLDHASSPDVNFDFAGTPSGPSLNCEWHGPGGARGRMTLKLLPASAVEVAWNATELGSLQWLVNGTATLSRK